MPLAELGIENAEGGKIFFADSPPVMRESRRRAVPYRSWNFLRNFGDAITADLLSDLFRTQPKHVEANRPHVLGVGSILHLATSLSHVWGSGIMAPNRQPRTCPKKIYALRGKKTAHIMSQLGYLTKDVPLGDPGILIDRILCDSWLGGAKKFKAAIIPHHNSFGRKYFNRFRHSEEVVLVNMMTHSSEPLRQIAAADVVISQSLHGLIFAESLGKPSVWISDRSDDVWKFKFEDWFSMTENPQSNPINIDSSFDLDEAIRAAEIRYSTINKDDLISSLGIDDFDESDIQITVPYKLCRSFNPVMIFDRYEEKFMVEDYSTGESLKPAFMAAAEVRDRFFAYWAEQAYCCIMGFAETLALTPEKLRVIADRMDRERKVNFGILVSKENASRTGAKFWDLSHGVAVARNVWTRPAAVFLRPNVGWAAAEDTFCFAI